MIIFNTDPKEVDIDINIKSDEDIIAERWEFYQRLRRNAPTAAETEEILRHAKAVKRRKARRAAMHSFFRSEEWKLLKTTIIAIVAVIVFAVLCEGIRLYKQATDKTPLHITYTKIEERD
jgi:hypothetical protein